MLNRMGIGDLHKKRETKMSGEFVKCFPCDLQVYEVESFATETSGTPEPRPFFEDPESNITVQLGAQVYMHCRVQNLQDTLKVNPHFSSFLDIAASARTYFDPRRSISRIISQ